MKQRDSRQPTLLVVDDEARNRKLLEGYLRSEEYAVLSASDGPTALRIARETRPDVILLDVMMPGMTGHEVCRALKQDEHTRICQVMMVTALGAVTDKIEGLDTGADDYLPKPVRREEFLAKVRALLRARNLLGELEEAQAALAARNQELELKKTLAQTLVHDLKNPLTAILGNLDLLKMRADGDLQYLIERSRRGSSRMLRMILNLLDVERLDEGALIPARKRLDATQLARAAAEDAETVASRSRIRLVVDVVDPVWVKGDADLLRRVLDNLLANAITHSPKGGTVVLRVATRAEGAELVVEDSGPGIPEEFRERIFAKYAQVGRGDVAGTLNRGLGLTFCRLAVEAHGGTIWVEDGPGGGACFRTVLPEASAIKEAGLVGTGAEF